MAVIDSNLLSLAITLDIIIFIIDLLDVSFMENPTSTDYRLDTITIDFY